VKDIDSYLGHHAVDNHEETKSNLTLEQSQTEVQSSGKSESNYLYLDYDFKEQKEIPAHPMGFKKYELQPAFLLAKFLKLLIENTGSRQIYFDIRQGKVFKK